MYTIVNTQKVFTFFIFKTFKKQSIMKKIVITMYDKIMERFVTTIVNGDNRGKGHLEMLKEQPRYENLKIFVTDKIEMYI